MTAIFVPSPPFKEPLVDDAGRLSRVWYAFILALYNRAGGPADKIEAAHAAAIAAVPQTAQIVGVGALHVGGNLTGNVALALYRALAAVADLPTSGINEGDWAYALNGRKAGEGAGSGTGVPVWFSGSGWFAVDSGAAVAA